MLRCALLAVLWCGSCWGDVCSSAGRRVASGEGPPLHCALSHSFVQVHQGVVPGLQYNVSVSNPGSEWLELVVLGAAETGSAACPALAPNATLALVTAPAPRNQSLVLQFDVRFQGAEVWFSLFFEFPIRPDYSLLSPQEDALLSSEDMEPGKAMLIQAPHSMGLQINIDAVILEDQSLLIYNVSEYSEAVSPHTKHLIFIVFENRFILFDYRKCSSCHFQLIIKILSTKYECNSTLRIPQGNLKLRTHSSTCELHLQALPFERIILKVTGASSFENEDCYLYQISIGSFAGKQNQKYWTPCSNASHTKTYISDTNVLSAKWNRSLEGVLLHYEFVLPCANHTYGASPVGHFCSSGFPDILFGCNQTHSLPFPSEVSLRVWGLQFCPEGHLCAAGVDRGAEREFLLSGSALAIRVSSERDLPGRGFCAWFRGMCPVGWAPHRDFCYQVVDQEMAWPDAEEACQRKRGHLASIRDTRVQAFIDQLIQNSSTYKRSPAFWIGANDLRYENCYEWTDGQPFYFSNWFPGWEGSVQPNDDGQQNCVELRNVFHFPGKGEGNTGAGFYWNDRDCRVHNPFVCQRTKPGVSVSTSCNRSVSLSAAHPQEVLTSPSFPAAYPSNAECHYRIDAPQGHRIVALFTDFVLEESDSCEYDVLTLIEGDLKWHRCGDWERKLKQLRHVSHTQSLHLLFTSDASHSYKGFRVELSILAEPESSLCDSDMFHLQKGKCYLLVNYPETSWGTARQICSEAKAQLVIVENVEQVTVLDQLVRSTYGYMSGVIYWVGAHSVNNTWKWLDGSLLNPKHLHVSRTGDVPSCLAIQWKQLRGANALRWTSKNCNHPGRFICQKPTVVLPQELNRTVSELSGNITSVNYPSPYLNDLDYRVSIVGPPNSRVVVSFQHFDLEWQEECLYDYVMLQSSPDQEGLKMCGQQLVQREFVSAGAAAYLSFHSDFSVSGSGFSARWEVVDLSPCLDRRLLVLEPVAVSSVRYPRPYLAPGECRVTALAPDPTHRMLVTIADLDVAPNDCLEVNLDPEEGKRIPLCELDVSPGMQLMAYGNEVQFWFQSTKRNSTRTYRGYNFTCETFSGTTLENTLYLNERKRGSIYSLNFAHEQPIGVNYSLRLVTRVGHRIHLVRFNVSRDSCGGAGGGLEVRSGPPLFTWAPCQEPAFHGAASTLHVLHINAWNFDGSLPRYFFEYSIQKDEHFVNTTQTVDSVESCRPNPCQHGGRCIANGTHHRCHCFGQYTGLFCHLTWCDVTVCSENGFCNLTLNGWKCECFPGFTGKRCQDTWTPCLSNPCGENGHCLPTNDSYMCRCALDFEGFQCEKLVMRIPYKPLSERMLEEPFWLGLITVFSVLLVILLVYCIKRKFADKIEKFLADEIERSKYQPSPPAARYSLSSTQPSLRGESPQTCPKSRLARMRKNSVRSPDATPRTFSFDDIMRRVHSAKRNNPPPPRCSAEEEKSRILASLVAPPKESRRMSLDEFFRMSERKLKAAEDEKKETSFISQPFLEIQSIQEQSFEYVSSSESLNEEPSTSQVQADVSPTPACSISTSPPPASISIKVDDCESDTKPDSESYDTSCDNKPQHHSCHTFTALSPIISRNSSYLEVPKTIPAVHVFSAESDEGDTLVCKPQDPCRKDFLHARKYSVDLPKPKILITTGSCDSDEASPPRTPSTKMVYLSPLAVIATDRTISESNLSTSGYSSISSLSRCNSSSPIADEKKPPAKAFFFPPQCHCHPIKRASFSTDDEGIGLCARRPRKGRSPSPVKDEPLSSSESDHSEGGPTRPKSRRSKSARLVSSQDSSGGATDSAPMVSSSSESISFPQRERMERTRSASEDSVPTTQIDGKRRALSVQVADDNLRVAEDHPYLRRQEAILEDDPSEDDSSSETTVLLGQSSSADISDTKE
ncbi:hypothetical protein JTE90_010843 [Oedothorax gibbosus]|uniref:Cubilin n=1 Tax=Oedothorax gibbosus TaxID=931172 RepID=A0AAV6V3D0_9ARAC|nr:hypothetical protein JTE90_010843 [Oedothorax gibbosus]